MIAIVAHHLGLGSSNVCHVGKREDWLRGSFDVCIPISIQDRGGQQPGQRVILWFPLPYRIGDSLDLAMGTKRYSVRLVHALGSSRIVRMFQFHGYMALRCLQVKLYVLLDDINLTVE